MAQGWIVTSHKFVVHGNPEHAAAEANRLSEKTGRTFFVMRVKNYQSVGAHLSIEQAQAIGGEASS